MDTHGIQKTQPRADERRWIHCAACWILSENVKHNQVRKIKVDYDKRIMCEPFSMQEGLEEAQHMLNDRKKHVYTILRFRVHPPSIVSTI